MPANIVLELTEGIMVTNTKLVQDILEQLRELGVNIAIDDFGTGYSSLGILRTLHADIIKIDKIFIRDFFKNQVNRIFIQTITELGHSIGMKVLLEGVEEWSEMEEIENVKLDYIQGFLFGRPMPEPEFTRRMKAD